MVEEIKAQETQVQETKTEEVQQPEKKEVDLITRVSQVKTETPKEKGTGTLEQEIQNLQTKEDVVEWAKKKESEWATGYGKKFQEISELRKSFESKLTESNVWTPEKLKSELNKPDFVQAAQQVLKTGSTENENFSALSDTEQAELIQLKNKINMLEKNSWEAVKANQDAKIATKYANYNPQTVDQTMSDLMTGKVQASREDLWKVLDYENAVKRAYELGLQDKNTQTMEKVNGMSFMEGRNMAQPSAVERQKGETVENFMRRSYSEHTKKK